MKHRVRFISYDSSTDAKVTEEILPAFTGEVETTGLYDIVEPAPSVRPYADWYAEPSPVERLLSAMREGVPVICCTAGARERWVAALDLATTNAIRVGILLLSHEDADLATLVAAHKKTPFRFVVNVSRFRGAQLADNFPNTATLSGICDVEGHGPGIARFISGCLHRMG